MQFEEVDALQQQIQKEKEEQRQTVKRLQESQQSNIELQAKIKEIVENHKKEKKVLQKLQKECEKLHKRREREDKKKGIESTPLVIPESKEQQNPIPTPFTLIGTDIGAAKKALQKTDSQSNKINVSETNDSFKSGSQFDAPTPINTPNNVSLTSNDVQKQLSNSGNANEENTFRSATRSNSLIGKGASPATRAIGIGTRRGSMLTNQSSDSSIAITENTISTTNTTTNTTTNQPPMPNSTPSTNNQRPPPPARPNVSDRPAPPLPGGPRPPPPTPGASSTNLVSTNAPMPGNVSSTSTSTTSTTTTTTTQAPVPKPARVPGKPTAPAVRNPLLDKSNSGLTEIDTELLEKTFLTKLSLNQNRLKNLPDAFKSISGLTFLDLSYNKFSNWPSIVCELKGLKEILFAGNRVHNFPDSLNEFNNLTRIDLFMNRLSEFPLSLISVPNLAQLNLGRNKFIRLPNEIAKLSSLTRLDLQENYLVELPAALGELKNLTYLDVNQNELESLPVEIGNLNSLSTLIAIKNQIQSLPDSIFISTPLKKLHLSGNKLNKLPNSLFDGPACSTMTELKLKSNLLTEIPNGLYQMENLNTLDLNSNRITEISNLIEQLQQLDQLQIGDNQIQLLPNEITNINCLRILNVFGNRLETLPNNLGKLAELSNLHVGYNQLIKLPSFEGLNELTDLFLSGNPNLQQLHESIYNLPILAQLYIANIGMINLPNSIGNITTLEKLDCSNNQLTMIPNAIASIGYLQHAVFFNNQINVSGLPSSLEKMSDLHELDLTKNNLEQLPDWLNTIVLHGGEVLIDQNIADKLPDAPRESFVLSTKYKVGYAEMIGRRPTMEDAFAVSANFKGSITGAEFYGVFDGHAGRKAASLGAKFYPQSLSEKLIAGIEPIQAMIQSFYDTNKLMEPILNEQHSTRHCGSTAVCVLIQGSKIYVANVGDSRAVLCRSGKPIRLSYDHKPYGEDEEQRILDLGGYVMGETGRVNGILAVSRSLADFYMHPFVSVEAYTSETDLTEQDEFLILGCDGVWDEVSDEYACQLVASESDPTVASSKLRDYSYLLESDDNISVMVIKFK
eukprot:TRINITY_DN2795_c0_g1_i1.p1 TRINITY_DN2795_c0_g1~~TRINITY_DN2795_c0_g1_i1.p1  ORF type:complete len:1074 (+),score=578.18 TRINITY_DN2795_c0_g1_i1:158-3379(+)